MKVLFIVLSGGKGMRLRPISFFMQKTLFPALKGKKIIDYAIKSSATEDIPGIEGKIFVLARCKSGQVVNYIRKKYPGITVLIESKAFDTGGALLQHWQSIHEYNPGFVVVLNGDHFVNLPLQPLLEYCQKEHPALLMMGIPSDEKYHDYINVNFDSERVLDKFLRRRSNIAYTGISIFRFDALEDRMNQLTDGLYNITTDIVEWIYAKYGGNYYVLETEWSDLGTWKRYLKFLYQELRRCD